MCNDIEKSFEELEETKKSFWDNHAKRMEELTAAVERVSTVTEDTTTEEPAEDIHAEIQSTLAECDELLKELGANL